MSKEYITKYRIVNNPSYNDFNDELPYTIIAVDYDPKTDLIRQKGFNGWSKIGDKLYDTRQECEKHFVFEINYELDNNVTNLQHRLEVAEKALELACEEIGRIEAKFGSAYIRANGYLLDYFKTKAKEMLENE